MSRWDQTTYSEEQPRPALLCISPSFAPARTPTAIRASKLLEHLSAEWDITVLSESAGPRPSGRVRVEIVRARRPERLLALIGRLRLGRLTELALWPDESIFWVAPAIRAGRRVIRERRPSAIVVFMMPYSAGLAGLVLSRLSGLPLVLNLDDSPTCTDMHPSFPTRLHYRLARSLEDLYVRRADEVVYVSARNLELVRARQPAGSRGKLHLLRYGADHEDFSSRAPGSQDFEVVYVGAMSGWWALLEDGAPASLPERLYDAWMRLGRYERVQLDARTSSPAVAGRAILEVLDAHPEWRGRVHLDIYGNPYPESLVARALQRTGIEDVVSVFGPVAHREAAAIVARADLLFLTLPNRLDGSPGGRISAKTYEYLATDRPILAAVPHGENWEYLEGKPGVWLVEPDDLDGIKAAILELAAAKLTGTPRSYDRSALREELSYRTRAGELAELVRAGIRDRAGGGERVPA